MQCPTTGHSQVQLLVFQVAPQVKVDGIAAVGVAHWVTGTTGAVNSATVYHLHTDEAAHWAVSL